MMKKIFLLAVLIVCLVSCQSSKSEFETKTPAEYVNPFIGTGGHGHTFPGATVPFGMVQLSPDTRTDSWDGCSGYHYSDSTILGFSFTHLSGTGVGDYGDFRFMPTVGALQFVPGEETDTHSGYRSSFSHATESAQAGYYSVFLNDDSIRVELTAGERFGMQRYSFPKTSEANVVLDLTRSVLTEYILDMSVQVLGDNAVCGFRRSKSWAQDQYLYFYAEFSQPFTSFGINLPLEEKNIEGLREAQAKDIQTYFRFNTTDGNPVVMRVGVSAVDVEGAKNNLLTESSDFDFDAQKAKAFEMWNNELKQIEVFGKNENEKVIFYSAYYHCMVSPNLYSDVDGRFRAHDLKIHQANERRYTVFSLWDTFRALHPLYNIMQRERSAEIINTFINNYETGGLLPVWELAANETNCMIGYHAIPVIVDAWQNGIRSFDGEKALEAMIKSANQDHFGLNCYKQQGFIPSECEGESVSKTLEYAYDDWCIAHMADMLGKQDVADEFYQRAQYYKNLYDADTKFMRGRKNGGFVTPFDPTQVNFMLTEANTWQYNFFVPQDVNGYIAMMGGDRAFERRLDEMFQSSSQMSGRTQADITGLIGQYAHGNEPSHHMAYLYNFVGKPIKTQKIINKVMTEFYTAEPDGLIGNEDCGQMSAWYVMNSMGFYPVTPGIGYYVIGVPRFDKVVLHLENGKTFVVEAKNISRENRYIKSVKLNGKKLKRSYIYYNEIADGGTLKFEMTNERNSTWATAEENRPRAEILAEPIVPVPTVTSPSKTFYDSLAIQLAHPDKKAQIWYSVNAGDPLLLQDEQIVICESSDIELWAVVGEVKSKAVFAEFKKIPAGRSISIKNRYNNQYEAGGDIALIDLLRGGDNFRTGTWQGYYGVDVEAVVDLGSVQDIHRLAAGFLQEEKSWIFMPKEVEFFVSKDGLKYNLAGTVTNTVADNQPGSVVQEMEINKDLEARFVKMIAKNIGNCPDWHVGAGEPAWIFCDEIVIE